MDFTSGFMASLGAWQRGWRERPERRAVVAENLRREIKSLPDCFRKVRMPCYRKRFLYKQDLPRLMLEGRLDEGMTSWTTNKEYANSFKGFYREEAVTAAIFKHSPEDSEVIVNISALWVNEDFVKAAADYRNCGGAEGDVLWNFKDNQDEVILDSPLIIQEAIGFTAISSTFDELCDQAAIPNGAKRDEIFKKLYDAGIFPGEPGFISEEATQRAIANTLIKFSERLRKLATKR